jgi:hypothetical protein
MFWHKAIWGTRTRWNGVARLGLVALGLVALSPATSATASDRAIGMPRLSAQIQIRPVFGPGGSDVDVRGRGFSPIQCLGTLTFTDASGSITEVGHFGGATFGTSVVIPANAAAGTGTMTALQHLYRPQGGCGLGPFASTRFTVTGSE